MTSISSSITALYSAMLLIIGPRQAPPEDTSWHEEEYITQAAETRFHVWRIAPSANPTNTSVSNDIYQPSTKRDKQ
jgi:hypothetical protein